MGPGPFARPPVKHDVALTRAEGPTKLSKRAGLPINRHLQALLDDAQGHIRALALSRRMRASGGYAQSDGGTPVRAGDA